LDTIRNAFLQDPKLDNLLLCPELHGRIKKAREGLAELIGFAVKSGTPVPAMSASLAYLDGLGSSRLPANLIQAQRDYFGAHTFSRIDGEGLFHHNWKRS
jgi:6-phosphogluconate dehydrogenase